MAGFEDPAFYGDRWADVYDERHEYLDPAPAVEFLAGLAGEGPVLELAIGTGRVALPLAARGIAVEGVDVSEAMVARLRAKPGGASIPVTMGDMADGPASGPFRLVYLVFNSLFGLLNQARQADCFRNAARVLEPGGAFVLECFVPDVSRSRAGQQVWARNVTEDSVTVGQMIKYLRQRLNFEDRPVRLKQMLRNIESRQALVCMFLAMLELVRLQAVQLRQDRLFGDILIRKHKGFAAIMEEQAAIRDDWR